MGCSTSFLTLTHSHDFFSRIIELFLKMFTFSFPGKLLAIGIIDEIRSTGELASPEHEKFKSILENIAHSFDDQSLFIFGWTPHSDLMSSIVMHSIDPRPNFIVINSSTLEYFLLDGEPQSWRITQLLERIRSRDDILKVILIFISMVSMISSIFDFSLSLMVAIGSIIDCIECASMDTAHSLLCTKGIQSSLCSFSAFLCHFCRLYFTLLVAQIFWTLQKRMTLKLMKKVLFFSSLFRFRSKTLRNDV